MPLSGCPSQQEWLAFHFGQMPAEQLNSLREHLENCQSCESSLEGFDPLTDPVIAALRFPASLSSAPRLDGRTDPTRVSAAGPLPSETAPTPPPVQLPSLPFLAPAQGADELGRLAHFRVLKVLGQGGMGIVFLAEDTLLRRRVALKVLKPQLAADPQTRLRFLREARAGAALRNDHVVVIHLVGEVESVPYFAMELLEGATLEGWRRGNGPPSTLQLMQVGREIAEGLAAAHENGLIHRDIKPTNIWIEPRSDGGFRVKLLDFGLAMAEAGETRLTKFGTLVGTPAYMAPEMAEGRRLDSRCDLFCLGSVLYYLATGTSPFAGDTTVAALWAVSFKQPVPLSRLQPGLPPALADLVMRLLAKDPDNRLPSARAVVDALRSIEIGEQPTAQVVRSIHGPHRRRRVLWLIPALGLLTGLAVLAGRGFWSRHEDQPAPIATTADTQAIPPTLAARGTEEEAWLKAVATMSPKDQLDAVVARLKNRNPGYDGRLGSRVLVNEKGVIELTFPSNHVTDLSPLRALTKLQHLNIGCDRPGERSPLTDLSPLAGLPLTDLQCASTSITSIAGLRGLPLQRLVLDKTFVHDLEPLRQMAALKMLSCGYTPIGELNALESLPLELLSIEVTRISDLGPLRKTPLKHLDCSGTLVDDLSPIAGKPIVYLKITNSRITNLEPLRTMKLDYLAANVDKVRDAKLLQTIETLRTINNIPVAEFWKQN